MKKRFQIFFMILALGLFISPTQTLFAKSETNCCTTEKPDTCKKSEKQDSGCSENHKTHQDCSDNCCTHCGGCHAFFISVLAPEENQKTQTHLFSEQKSAFNYSSPYISTALQEIWQPPKIA